LSPGPRLSPAYLPLALLPLLLWLLTSQRVAIPPVWWVAVLAVVVVGLWTALLRGPARWFDLLPAGLLGVAATHRLLLPGFPQGHDIITHLWGTYGFFQAILDGNLLPRWIHHIGLGMPFLLFYPPLAFYGMLPFLALEMPVFDAFKGGFVLFSVLSGLAMFRVVQRWTGDRRAALVAAGAYCYAPYHVLQSNYRVSVAEAAAMAVLPLFFYAMARAIEDPQKGNVRWAALWTAVLAMTHPLSLSMAGTGMAIWLAAQHGWGHRKALGRSIGLLMALGILGVGLAGYYTVPVAAEGSYVTISSALGGKKSGPMYLKHGLLPQQLIERRAWHKWQKSESRGSSEEKKGEMPFYFGLTLLALLPLARSRHHPELVRGLRAMTLGTLALCLFPLDVLFGYFPPMSMLQFSWRFLTIATVGASVLAGFAVVRILEDVPRPWLERLVPGLLFGLLVLDFYPYGGAAMWAKPYEGVYKATSSWKVPDPLPFRVDHLSYPPSDPSIELSSFRRAYPEYFTPEVRQGFYRAEGEDERAQLERIAVSVSFRRDKTAAADEEFPRVLTAAPYAEFRPAGGGAARALAFTRGGEKIRVQLPGEDGMLVIKEQWFPGWDAALGAIQPRVEKTEDGLMMLEVEAVDTGELVLSFSRTRWDRLLGILLSLGIGAGLCWPARRKRIDEPVKEAV